MSIDYTDLQAQASDLLKDFGATFTLRRTVEATGGTAFDPGSAPLPPDEYSVSGILDEYEDRVIDDSLIKRGDRKAIIDAVGLEITPESGDQIVALGETYKVINVTPVNPAGTPVIYILQIRR